MAGVLNPTGATVAAPTPGHAAPPGAVTPVPAAKFPGAKTYKDKQGNIREVGTGRLIRAVKKTLIPAKKTGNTYFTDGQGVVRRIGTGVAKNPLDAAVDSAILNKTAPMTNQKSLTDQQFAADQNVLHGSNTALQSQLGSLSDRISQLGAQQLGAAATAAGGTATAQTANLDYLKSILGSNMSDGGASLPAQVAGLAAQAQSEGASANAGIALGQRGQQSDLAGMGAANAMQTQSAIANQMRAHDAAQQTLNSQITAAKGDRTAVKNDLVNTSLSQAAARQQMSLASQQLKDAEAQQVTANDFNQQQLDNQTAAQKAAAAADAAKTAAAAKDATGVYGLGAAKDSIVAAQIGAWNKAKKHGGYGGLVAMLTGSGAISGVDAVRIANHTIGNAGIKSEGVRPILKVLKNNGVSTAVQRNIINNIFGPTAVANFFGAAPGTSGQYGGAVGAAITAPGNAPASVTGKLPKVGSTVGDGWKVKSVQNTATGGYVITFKGKDGSTRKAVVPVGGNIATAIYKVLN